MFSFVTATPPSSARGEPDDAIARGVRARMWPWALVTILAACRQPAPPTPPPHDAFDASVPDATADARTETHDAGIDARDVAGSDARPDAMPEVRDSNAAVHVPVGEPIPIARDTSFVRSGFHVRVDRVVHPDLAVRAAISMQLHAWLSDAAIHLDRNADGWLRCECTLALTSLVSFVCVAAETRASRQERGMIGRFPRRDFRTFVWAIDGSELHAVDDARLVDVDDAGIAIAACRRRARFGPRSQDECDNITDTYVAVEPRGLIVVFRRADAGSQVERVLFTWRELGRAVHRNGPLARVPHALQYAADRSTAFPDEYQGR